MWGISHPVLWLCQGDKSHHYWICCFTVPQGICWLRLIFKISQKFNNLHCICMCVHARVCVRVNCHVLLQNLSTWWGRDRFYTKKACERFDLGRFVWAHNIVFCTEEANNIMCMLWVIGCHVGYIQQRHVSLLFYFWIWDTIQLVWNIYLQND